MGRRLRVLVLVLVMSGIVGSAFFAGFLVAAALPSWVFDDPAPGGATIHSLNVAMTGVVLGLVFSLGGLGGVAVTYARISGRRPPGLGG